MAAVTSTVVALAGVGLSAAKYAKANQEAKSAQNAAKAAAQELSGISESNAFNELAVPRMGFDLASQGIDRQAQAALSAVQGAGAEGVIGGVANIGANVNQSELELAAQANEAEYNRDALRAEAQQGINVRKAERQESLGAMKLRGSQAAANQAEQNKADAISEGFGALSKGLTYGSKLVDLYNDKGQKVDQNGKLLDSINDGDLTNTQDLNIV